MKRLAVAALVIVACKSGGGGDSDGGGIPTEPRPGKRSDVGGALVATDGRIVLFGGDDGPIVNQIPSARYLEDTWLLDPTNGWRQISSPGPSARGRHAVATDGEGKLWSFGGRWRQAMTTGDYTLYGDLWEFDADAETWTEVSDGGGPAPRYFATAAYDNGSDSFYVYGGGTNADALSIVIAEDLWRFQAGVWSEIDTTGAAPSPRLFMAHTYDSSRNRLVVFGGQIGDFVTPAENDLYAVDLASGEWTQLHNGAGTAPGGRFSSMMTYDAVGDRYILFGGHADAGVTNDTWAFDPNTMGWSELASADTFTGAALGCLENPAEIPKDYVTEDLSAPERRSGGIFEAVDGVVYLFGGESDCSDHLDDTWILDLASGTWSELIPARTGESCGRRGDDCECLCL